MSIQLTIIIMFLVIMIFVAYAFAFSNQYRLNKTIKIFKQDIHEIKTMVTKHENIITYLDQQYNLTKESENDEEI